MSLTLVTAPTEEPFTLNQGKSQLRIEVDNSTEDDLVESLIQLSRDYFEQQTGRAMLTQTWKYTADAFPQCNGVIKLRRAPLVSVASIQYVDTSGNPQTLATNQYIVDTTAVLGEITPAYGVVWPTTQPQRNAVTVTFTAGYDDPSSIPASYRGAMLMLISEFYTNRESSLASTTIQNPQLRMLIDSARLPNV